MNTCPISQRGATTVIVTLALLAATLLMLLAANRQLLLELRLSGNQVRSAEAFEAADAGLDWAGAMLNGALPAGADCRPAPAPAPTFRERYLAIDATHITPRPAADGGPRVARCAHDGATWHCTCPDDAGTLPAPHGPSFAVRFADAGRPGVVRVVVDGDGPPDAVARHETLLTLQPALASPPPTALTLRDPALPPQHFFAGLFGLSRAAWAAQPTVARLDCRGDCGAALAPAIGPDVRQPLVYVDGDLLLRGPLALGTAERPVLLVVAGRLRIEGAVDLQGAAYAADVSWSAPTGAWRGALMTEGGAAGVGTLDLVHDATVLQRLRSQQGSFVPVPGSWRDF
ncbi:MAG: hypothetical protein KF788_08500 [Piscinibacter sp.]|nr:hypothetical protein [Piscinibacter sp.]